MKISGEANPRIMYVCSFVRRWVCHV